MLYATLKILHLLSIMIWVGGMVFVLAFLRPALASMVPEQRVRLMHAVLGRFFQAVQWLAALALLSGGWMMTRVSRQSVDAGAHVNLPLEWLVMAALGTLMLAVFVLIRWRFFSALSRQVAASEWAEAAASLNAIRRGVLVNLTLAALIVVVTLAGVSS